MSARFNHHRHTVLFKVTTKGLKQAQFFLSTSFCLQMTDLKLQLTLSTHPFHSIYFSVCQVNFRITMMAVDVDQHCLSNRYHAVLSWICSFTYWSDEIYVLKHWLIVVSFFTCTTLIHSNRAISRVCHIFGCEFNLHLCSKSKWVKKT